MGIVCVLLHKLPIGALMTKVVALLVRTPIGGFFEMRLPCPPHGAAQITVTVVKAHCKNGMSEISYIREWLGVSG